ncbi:hypothetical protein EEB14_15565 [Rhodococcus sp. WS4]|nr:hypothetical protein EEB14_15565 [Rhodococcus sp. WS4]
MPSLALAGVRHNRTSARAPIPFLAAMPDLIISALLGAVSGFISARRGWRLTRSADGGAVGDWCLGPGVDWAVW